VTDGSFWKCVWETEGNEPSPPNKEATPCGVASSFYILYWRLETGKRTKFYIPLFKINQRHRVFQNPETLDISGFFGIFLIF